MSDRPKHHFRRLVPFGLIWGFFTGIVLHFWWNGFTFNQGLAYWLTLALIWGGAGLLWAYLTAKYSKRKTPNSKPSSKEVS